MADGQIRANFGATPFARTPPAGFTGLDAATEIQVIPITIAVVGATLTVEGSSTGPTGIGWSTTFKGPNVTLSDGNLRASASLRGGGRTETIITGKKYWEITIVSRLAIYEASAGWVNSGQPFSGDTTLGGLTSGVGWYSSGEIFYNGAVVAVFDSFTTGDTLSFAVDGSSVWLRVNGASWNANPAANPATGVGAATQNEGDIYPAYQVAGLNVGGEILANFGATSFLRTPPAGFAGFDEPSSAEINIFPSEIEIDGATLAVAGSPEVPVDFIPAFIEIVGSSLLVAGSGEIAIVPAAIELVGPVLLINDLAAATAINVIFGRVDIEGAILSVTTSEITVVPGEVEIDGAILLVVPRGISIVPGELHAEGAILTVSVAIILHVVPGEVEIDGAIPSVGGIVVDGGVMELVGTPIIGPLLTANVSIGG